MLQRSCLDGALPVLKERKLPRLMGPASPGRCPHTYGRQVAAVDSAIPRPGQGWGPARWWGRASSKQPLDSTVEPTG